MTQVDKLNRISTPDTAWRKDAQYRKDNREWLMNSAKVALIVLRTLKDIPMTQRKLAEEMGVKPQQITKIVKGKENLTLETISRLEKALDIIILDVKIVGKQEITVEHNYTVVSGKRSNALIQAVWYPPFKSKISESYVCCDNSFLN